MVLKVILTDNSFKVCVTILCTLGVTGLNHDYWMTRETPEVVL